MTNKPMNVCLFGGRKTGKSGLLKKLQGKQFSIDEPTISCNVRHWKIDTLKSISINFWEINSNQRQLNSNSERIKNADYLIFVYDITNRASFKYCRQIIDQVNQIRTNKNKSAIRAIIGNKVDLKNQRQVITKEGEKLAKDKECRHFETSAKDEKSVNEVFNNIINNEGDLSTVIKKGLNIPALFVITAALGLIILVFMKAKK